MELVLTLENSPSHRRMFRIPEPVREVEILLRILQTHLERFTAPSPVVAVALEAFPTRVVSGQANLFTRSWKDPNRLADTLARVEALLGAERMGTPRSGISHRPDSFQMHPFSLDAPPESVHLPGQAPAPGDRVPPGPPLRRFRPRRPVAVGTAVCQGCLRPDAILSGPLKGSLSAQNGPWTTSGDWWREADWQRAEWDVRHESGACYRLVLEREKWFVEGLYD